MRRAFSSRMVYVLLLVWLAGSLGLLFVASTAPWRNASVPLEIGLFRASGARVILVALLPALCGLAAWIGIVANLSYWPYLLLLYSLFWLVALLGGLVAAAPHFPTVAAAQVSAWSWLTGSVTFAVMLAGFFLLAVWSIQQMSPSSAERRTG